MLKFILNIIYLTVVLMSCSKLMFGQNISGSGTALDPYILYNKADIDSIAVLGTNKYYKLGNDIDFESGFTAQMNFTGSFDGDNYTMSNWTRNTGAFTTMALFNAALSTDAFIIKNVKLYNWNTTINGVQPYTHIGFLYATGGNVLLQNIEITKCSLTIIGTTALDFANRWAGMIGGRTYNGTATQISLDSCYLYATGVGWQASDYIGLMFGSAENIQLSQASVSNSYMYGKANNTVTQDLDNFSVLGRFQSSAKLRDCYVKNVTMESPSTSYTSIFKGFISGTDADSVINCYAAQVKFINVRTASKYPFAVTTSIDLANCFVDTLSGGSSLGLKAGLTGQDSTKMKTDSLYVPAGWDFINTWGVSTAANSGYPYLLWNAPAPPDTAIVLYHPRGGQIYNGGDTINISFRNTYQFGNTNLDSVNIYYSTNAGSTWIFLTHVDTVPQNYSWTTPNITNTTMRIKVFDDDSLFSDESDFSFSIYATGAAITIINPTAASQTMLGSNLKIQVESVAIDWFSLIYSKDGSDFQIIADSLSVDPGDGIVPDTTTYYWDISGIPLTGSFTIKAYSLFFIGSSTVPLYEPEGYVIAGTRAHTGSAQSKNFWSNFFVYDDELYTLNYWAFTWGWYDYSDQTALYKWNKTTNVFYKVTTKYSPGSAYYPRINVFRSSATNLVMHNQLTGSKSVYKTQTITYPVTISDWSANISDTPPANIDVNVNTVIDYEGWRYTLNPTLLRIMAVDLNNPLNQQLIIDDLDAPTLDPGNIDFYVFDDHILISAARLQSTGTYGGTVWSVGVSLPINTDISDDVTFVLQGASRNYFRGVYPNAIIQYYPPIR